MRRHTGELFTHTTNYREEKDRVAKQQVATEEKLRVSHLMFVFVRV